MSTHNFVIKCKSCDHRWNLKINLSGNPIEAFAAVCHCGALIIGNFNYLFYTQSINSDTVDLRKIYLSNGNFVVLNLSEKEKNTIDNLDVY